MAIAPVTPADAVRDHRFLRLMAAGFGVGSALFALGTVFVWAEWPAVLANATYALGAVCFTLAALVQVLAARAHRRGVPTGPGWSDPDLVSALVQLAGTLYFNAMTVRALLLSLGAGDGSAEVIWHADAVGSGLFLISSWIAWHPVARRRRHRHIPRRSAWICWANMAGSVFFGLSAWGAMPEGDAIRSTAASNVGTFLGALCFLVGSALLWPEQEDDEVSGHPGEAVD